MDKNVFIKINELLVYAEENLGLKKADLAYKRNRILEILGIDTLEDAVKVRRQRAERFA